MVEVPFLVYDADHHIYEPEDAFSRYLPKPFRQDFYFVEQDGRKRLVIDGIVSAFLPNPTFDVVAAPGCHEKWMRAENPEGLTLREMTGQPLRTPPEWRDDPERRLRELDKQGIHAALLLPTLASIIESRLESKPATIAALFHSLNQWMAEEWGFSREDRLFSVPFISLAEIDTAIRELEFALANGARTIGIRPAPVPYRGGGLSPGNPIFDPFWARVAEAGIFVCLHSSVTRYGEMINWWTGDPKQQVQPFARHSLKSVLDHGSRNVADAVAALICNGVFDRHPTLIAALLEHGASWVEPLMFRLGRAYGQMPQEFREDPRETFRRHFYVAPGYEDDVDILRQYIPVERMLFASDYPHAEGIAEPLRCLDGFRNFTPAEVEMVFSSNLRRLLEGRATLAKHRPVVASAVF